MATTTPELHDDHIDRLRTTVLRSADGQIATRDGYRGLLPVLAVAAVIVITNNDNRARQTLAVQGRITDRVIKTVEQLGQVGIPKIDVRLGAIYCGSVARP